MNLGTSATAPSMQAGRELTALKLSAEISRLNDALEAHQPFSNDRALTGPQLNLDSLGVSTRFRDVIANHVLRNSRGVQLRLVKTPQTALNVFMPQRRSLMTRSQLLAAEIFGYSFANYSDHLDIGNARFDSLMPQDAETLERAELESWPITRLARSLQVDEVTARGLLDGYARARTVVDADNPAESFRHAVRFLISDAAAKGISTDEAKEDLVRQICYRAADLAYLLDIAGQPLSRYSRHLRREPEVEYYDGYFDDDAQDQV